VLRNSDERHVTNDHLISILLNVTFTVHRNVRIPCSKIAFVLNGLDIYTVVVCALCGCVSWSEFHDYLVAFAELRKATATFMSVRSHGTAGLPLDGFSRNLIFEYFSENISRKIQISLQPEKNNRYFTC
jgi:hypothetical protein